ncbi:MAG: ohr [bacterium]|nr:ohr [bacterium]
MKPLYTATVSATGGRDGRVHSAEPPLDLALATPKALGGPGGDATNPEQLFAAGYAACFESALRLVARMQKRPLDEATITARVTLGKEDEGAMYRLAVELRGRLPGRSPEEARALLDAAHQVCPYSRATRGNIDVTLVVES